MSKLSYYIRVSARLVQLYHSFRASEFPFSIQILLTYGKWYCLQRGMEHRSKYCYWNEVEHHRRQKERQPLGQKKTHKNVSRLSRLIRQSHLHSSIQSIEWNTESKTVSLEAVTCCCPFYTLYANTYVNTVSKCTIWAYITSQQYPKIMFLTLKWLLHLTNTPKYSHSKRVMIASITSQMLPLIFFSLFNSWMQLVRV